MAKTNKKVHGIGGEENELLNEPIGKNVKLGDKKRAIEMPDGKVVDTNKDIDVDER